MKNKRRQIKEKRQALEKARGGVCINHGSFFEATSVRTRRRDAQVHGTPPTPPPPVRERRVLTSGTSNVNELRFANFKTLQKTGGPRVSPGAIKMAAGNNDGAVLKKRSPSTRDKELERGKRISDLSKDLNVFSPCSIRAFKMNTACVIGEDGFSIFEIHCGSSSSWRQCKSNQEQGAQCETLLSSHSEPRAPRHALQSLPSGSCRHKLKLSFNKMHSEMCYSQNSLHLLDTPEHAFGSKLQP